MKQLLLLTVFIFSFSILKSQDIYFDFTTQVAPCPYDASVSTTQFLDWEIYKTLDDTWNGTIDSTFCFNISANNILDWSNLGIGETIFLRQKLTNSNKVLLTHDNLYSLNLDANITINTQLQLGDTCANGLCSGLIVGIEIPDSLGTGKTMRWHEAPVENHSSGGYLEVNSCIPTEYFQNGNYLREVIFKATIGTQGIRLNIYQAQLNDVQHYSYLRLIQDSLIVPFSTFFNEYNYNTYFSLLIAKNDTTIYPNSYGIEYVDIIPSPNVDTPVTMNIEIEYEASLTLQPFVELQGGYVLNDSSQRHNYNIINNGGSFCFPTIIEKIFTSGNNYIHNSGEVGFSGKMSCMAFGAESKLVVGEAATLYYGNGGTGNLALYPNSEIELKKDASFVLDNNLILFGSSENKTPSCITLNEGNQLIFGKFAKIKNHKSVQGIQQLDVYMKGGTIDFSQLDNNSRQYLNLIYENATTDFQENVKILGNPVYEVLSFSITNKDKNTTQIELLSIEGKVIFSEMKALDKGVNYLKIPISHLSNGLYFLNIQSKKGNETKKIIITQ